MPSRIRIKNKTLNRLRTGHLWVYSEEIENPRPEMDGTIVALESDSGEFVGQGFFNSRSRIAFRLLGKYPYGAASVFGCHFLILPFAKHLHPPFIDPD